MIKNRTNPATADRIDQALWTRLRGFFQSRVSDLTAAEDLTQELLLNLIAKGGLDRFVAEEQPDAAHLLNFIAKCARNHLINHFRHRASGRQRVWGARVEFDETCEFEPVFEDPAAALQFAELEQAVGRGEAKLGDELRERGRAEVFAAVRPHLQDSRSGDLSATYERLTGTAGLSPGAARTCLSRTRNRFRQLVRKELELAA